MDFTLRIFLFVLSVLFLAFALLRIRRGRYLLKYSLVWIVLSIVGVISAVVPGWIYQVSSLLGFQAPSNFVYFVLIGFLLIVSTIYGGILSKQEGMLRSLVQEVSILKSAGSAKANADDVKPRARTHAEHIDETAADAATKPEA